MMKRKSLDLFSKSSEVFMFDISGKPLEEQVKLLILRDLLRLDWEVKIQNNKIEVLPPVNYNKETIKQSMAIRRNEIID